MVKRATVRTYLRPVLGAASVIAESCAGYVREFSPTALPAPEPPGALQAGGSQPWPLKKRKARSHGRFKKRKEAPGAGYIELAVPKANGACQGQSDADRDRGQSLDDPLRLRTYAACVRTPPGPMAFAARHAGVVCRAPGIQVFPFSPEFCR